MTDDEVRARAAVLLDNMASVEEENISDRHADCFYCRETANTVSSLRFAAAALRDPTKL